jgi:transposase-like protein
MPKHSTVIDHPDRAAIERGLAIGTPIKQLARKYGLSQHTLYRYRVQIPPQLKAAHLAQKLKAGVDLEKLRIDESDGLLQNLAAQRARLLLCQDQAIEVGDARLVAYLAGEVHRNLRLVGQYLGEFAKVSVQANVSLLVAPQYLDMRASLMKALAPYGEARRAVAAALHAIEAEAAAAPSPKAELPSPPMIDGVATEVSVA